jgi:hypothetical protein
MVLKSGFAAIICLSVLAGSGPARADAYMPDELLSLDLKKAVLSPKLIGPPAQFEQVPVAAKTDARIDAKADLEVKSEPEIQVTVPRAHKRHGIVHARAATPRPAHIARTRLVRRHSNPLDAQASDTRIQVWPCKSGGICNWR